MAFRLQRRVPQASVQHLRVPPRQRRPKDRDRPERPLRRLQDVLQSCGPLHGLHEGPSVPQDVPRLRHPLGQNQLSPYLIISPCVKSSEPLTSSPTASCEQDWGNFAHERRGEIIPFYVEGKHLTFNQLQVPALQNRRAAILNKLEANE